MDAINGQPSLFLLDLTGKEYPAIAVVNRKRRVNGQREISLSFLYAEINADFLHDIEFGWKILFQGEWYTITNPTYQLDGEKFSVGVDAVLSFFVDLNGHYLQDTVENKSMTPAAYFGNLFQGTGYSYVLVSNLLANTLSYQPNETKTSRFLYGIDRFKAEYVIRGKQAYVHDLIGLDKDVILHEDLNIQDVSVEVDASGFHTWAKGFGDLDEETGEYRLEIPPYISPLAEKYGMIEGPAIYNGSFKHGDALTEAVQKQVENSYKVSTTITPIDLTNNGYPEMKLDEGDRVWLYVTRLKLNTLVRVIEIQEVFDWEGNIISVQYTLGNESIATRYKTQQYDTLKDFNAILKGDKVLEFDWLPEAIKRASDIINGNLDSYFIYGAGEIIGINRNNPNEYMKFNTDGIGFSRDGGKTYQTAITYEGINTYLLTAGEIRTNNIKLIGRDNLFYWDGNALQAYDPNNRDKFVKLSSDGLNIKNGMIKVEGQAGTVIIDGTSNMHKILATGIMNINVPAGAVTFSASISHNLGYTPAFSAFMQGDSTQPIEDGFSYALPRTISSPGGDSLIVQSIVTGGATKDKFHVWIERSQGYGSNLPAKTIVVRYFIYKEVAF